MGGGGFGGGRAAFSGHMSSHMGGGRSFDSRGFNGGPRFASRSFSNRSFVSNSRGWNNRRFAGNSRAWNNRGWNNRGSEQPCLE